MLAIKKLRKLCMDFAFDVKKDPVYGNMSKGVHPEYFRNRAIVILRDELSHATNKANALKLITVAVRHLLWYYMLHPEDQTNAVSDASESR